MPAKHREPLPPGYIVYMHRCGKIIDILAWGEGGDSEFLATTGPRSPRDIARVTPRCPECGELISPRPIEIKILTLKEVDIDEVKEKFKRGEKVHL